MFAKPLNRATARALGLVLLFASCATARHQQAQPPSQGTMTDNAKTPLLAPWPGPNGGVPPFDQIHVADFKPALEQGMADNLREIDTIANNQAAPTFDNTLVALERAGHPLTQAMSLFGVWGSVLSTPEFRKVEVDMAPKLAEFGDRIIQNGKLFARIKTVYDTRDSANLTPEQKRLLWVTYNNFVRQGANLDADKKAELAKVNQQLATLYTKFGQNQLGDEEHYALTIDKKADLAGLPESQIAAAATEAERRGEKGKWVIANTRSAMEPFLTYAQNRALREQGWKLWVSRGDNGDERDNNANVREILQLRARKAKLLGYPTYAHWHLSDTMAKDPERAMELMMSVWKPAAAQFRKDAAEAQVIADKEHAHIKIQPWDYRYYAEKLRKAKYDLDLNEVKPYLQVDHLREAMFWAAGQLYGFTFTKVEGLSVYQPDVTVYEVMRGGAHVGYWYFDPYARPGKQSGAWMNAYREQQRLDGVVPTIVSNNANFMKGKAGEPVTVSWDDARTMFHEFGHALHGLNSNVTYPSLSGTNTARDFVEFPSQFNENYLTTPEVLKFFVNGQGQPIPADLLARIKRAEKFNQGFLTAEAQASAIVDMKMHLAGDTPIDPKTFEKTTLAEIGMPPQMVMRHRIPAFGHVFSGEGYAAGYYGYIWAEVLEHDAFEAFKEAGGPYDKDVAKRLESAVMSVGNTVDPAEAFRNFRGRDPKPDALLRSKGFPVKNN
jgi:peptidyl-dipeptidase Dcp